MENKKEMTLRKIPLKVFIETLISIYEGGADYIDISGIPDEIQDTVTVSVKADYFSKENQNEREEFDIEDDEEEFDYDEDITPDTNKDLSDDDLNQLL